MFTIVFKAMLTVSIPANKMSIIVQMTSFGSILRTTSMSSMMLKLLFGSSPFSLIDLSVWLMYLMVVLSKNYSLFESVTIFKC